MSGWICGALIGFYVLLGLAAVWEREPWKAVYWFAACLITLAVYKM